MKSAIIMMSATALLGWAAREAAAQSSVPVEAAPVRGTMSSRLAHAYRLKEDGRAAAALAAFKVVLKTDPGNTEALTEVARLHASMKQWIAAAEYFKKVVEQDPGDMRLRMELGHARASMEDFEGAAEEFRVVANEHGELQGKAQEALKSIGGRAAEPANSARRRTVDEGWAALRRGDRATARRKFEAALADDPKDAALLKQIAFMHLHDGRMDDAVKNFEAARSLDAEDHFVALQLGYLYDRLDRKEQARAAFTAALASPDERIHAAAQAALSPSAEDAVKPKL